MSHPHESLSAGPHERHGLLRTDAAWLDTRWADPASRVLVISGTRIRPGESGPEWIGCDDAPDGVRVLLGEHDGVTSWAVIVDGEVAKAEPERWIGLRGALPTLAGLAPGDAPLLLHAIGLAEWHWSHRFCPRCGGALSPRSAGHELVCADCGKPQFPRLDPAVIMLIAAGEPGSDDERCLLGRNSAWPAGRFSTLAGFCEPGESLEDAVRREVLEETGVVVGEVTYFGNQPWPLPSSLMIGFFGRAESESIVLDDVDVEEAEWFTRAQMRERATDGSLVLPGGVSISRSLIEHWYGGPLPGQW